MKTPNEIADVAMQNLAGAELDHDTVRNAIAEVIKADRAQRKEIEQGWRDDQGDMRQADHVTVAWRAYDEHGRLLFNSDALLTSEQAVGMFQGIGEAS